MALAQLPEIKGKKLPACPGWYWLKVGRQNWAPIWVDQKAGGIPTVKWFGTDIEVGDIESEWGEQIFPPA